MNHQSSCSSFHCVNHRQRSIGKTQSARDAIGPTQLALYSLLYFHDFRFRNRTGTGVQRVRTTVAGRIVTVIVMTIVVLIYYGSAFLMRRAQKAELVDVVSRFSLALYSSFSFFLRPESFCLGSPLVLSLKEQSLLTQ
jgi:hypothetical protein